MTKKRKKQRKESPPDGG